MSTILEVTELETYFENDLQEKAVDGISFELQKGEILGIVGESGSGKSVTAKSIMNLIDPPGYIKNGKIIFDGKNLLELNEGEMQKIRGKDIAYLIQNPMSAFNPMFTIYQQFEKDIRRTEKISKSEARKRADECLRKVGLGDVEEIGHCYPHQFSGGMLQRAALAFAVSKTPQILIADEPTTALDTNLQKQILQLIKKLQTENDMSIIVITHNFSVIWEICDRVLVMKKGKIVEQGKPEDIYYSPKDEYTKVLMESLITMNKVEK